MQDPQAPQVSEGERLRYVLCEKCKRDTVIKVGQRAGERDLLCTTCEHRWTVKDYTP